MQSADAVRSDRQAFKKEWICVMGKAEEYLDRIPMWTRKKNSLEDVRRFLDYMGAPDRERPAIHVAGTNGKGSVCAFLTSMLREAGYRTGTFISPHLVEVRERFLIDGKMVDQESFEEAFEAVLAASRELAEQGFCHPTFFEFLFYMAMVLFKRQEVDVMILETGLGGRLALESATVRSIWLRLTMGIIPAETGRVTPSLRAIFKKR